MPGIDWSLGHYEQTDHQMLPAAAELVAQAHLRPGDRVIDLGCGSGNASLVAARAGAAVVGVDPTPRLLDVARARAADEGLTIRFVEGDAASIPVESGSARAVLSVFGVIFAPDPVAAATEMARVLAPGGRILFSAWLRGGDAVSKVLETVGQRAGQALGQQPGTTPPFAWHDPAAVAELFAPLGLRVTSSEHDLAFTADSPVSLLDGMTSSHPAAIGAFELLTQLGQADAVRAEALHILETGNEDERHFRSTARYVIMTAHGE